MTSEELDAFLRDKSNWSKSRSDEDLWHYCNITKHIKVGRQMKDWAIFINNKNEGFYFTEEYKMIPNDLIINLLNKLSE